jgi:hypothetical protein
MASQLSSQSPDSGDEVYYLPEPVYVPSQIVHTPLSPPPTVKKIVSIFSTSPFHVHDSQRRSRRSKLNPLDPGQSSQSPRCSYVKLCYVLFVLLALFCWWRSGTAQDLESMRQRANNLPKNLLPSSPLDGLYFIPANNRHIHVSAEAGLQTT